MADRFGSTQPLVIGFIALAVALFSLSLATTSLVGSLPALFIWGAICPHIFISQQHRLLSLAPEHTSVILALNNSMLYLVIAGGAALGGVALLFILVTRLGWVGAGCALLALFMLFLSIRVSAQKK